MIHILYWVVAFVVLWVLFVNAMWLMDNKDKLPEWAIKPLAYFVYASLLYDVLFNIVYGTIMFLGKPDFAGAHIRWKKIGFPTLTERLRAILRGGKRETVLDRFRYYQARFICRYLVEPWDRGHCGLEKLGIAL